MSSFRNRSLCSISAIVLAVLASHRPAAADEPFAKLQYPLSTEAIKIPAFELDLSEADDDADVQKWGAAAKKMCHEWFPIACRFLATDGWNPPETVYLVFKKDLAAPAATSGARIEISVKWIKDHPDDFGMAIHELCHVIQNYPPGQPGWLVEGIADYIRYWRYEPEAPHGRIDRAKASYRDGYGTTATFLAWITWRYDKRIVPRLDEAMRKKQYDDAIFRQSTGKDLEPLWAEFLEHQRP